MDEQEFFERLAELAVRVGTNLQPGQELVVFGDVEHAPLVISPKGSERSSG